MGERAWTDPWVWGFYWLIAAPSCSVVHLEKLPMTKTLCGVHVENDAHCRGVVETCTDRLGTSFNFHDTQDPRRRLPDGAEATPQCAPCFTRARELEAETWASG